MDVKFFLRFGAISFVFVSPASAQLGMYSKAVETTNCFYFSRIKLNFSDNLNTFTVKFDFLKLGISLTNLIDDINLFCFMQYSYMYICIFFSDIYHGILHLITCRCILVLRIKNLNE